jgi:stage II sporulation protein M
MIEGGSSMKLKIGQVIGKHIEAHASLYIFSIVLFLMGVIFGTLTVQSMGYSQQADLFYYFQQFMIEMKKDHFVDQNYALQENFIHYLKYTGVIWILGLSIIGLPVILILLFLKGVFIGFTVGFLVHQLGWNGFLFAFIAVLPQNMIVVPVILFMSVLSISFSMKLIAHLFGTQRYNEKLSIPKYIGALVAMSGVLFMVSIFETYLSPLFMKMMS